MDTEQTICKVAAAVIEKDGKILIAQRSLKDVFGGLWEFPGGKVEPGETLEEALKRELYEELEIVAEIGSFLCTSLFVYKNRNMEMNVFNIISFTGELCCHVHQDIRWVTREELRDYSFTQPDYPIIKLLTKE